MKVEVMESQEAIGINLIPENTTEVGQLMRYANNAKLEKPFVHLGFRTILKLFISLKKVKESVQKNSIVKY